MEQHGGVPLSSGESSSGKVWISALGTPKAVISRFVGLSPASWLLIQKSQGERWAFSKALWRPQQLGRDRHQSALGRREGSQVSPGAVSQVSQPWGTSFMSTGTLVLPAPNPTLAHFLGALFWITELGGGVGRGLGRDQDSELKSQCFYL